MTSDVSVGAPVSASPPTNEVLPAGWRRVLLQDVARLESGHTPSRKHPEWWGGDIAWLSLKDVSSLDGKFIEETQDYTNELGIANSSARLLPEGTVCLCRTASVGNAVILGREMATSQDFANWVCNEELDPEYLLAAFLSSQREFAKEKQGSTHKTIYMPTIRKFQVLLPPLEQQRRIVTILDKADALRRMRQESLALMDEFLRSVFLEMFGDPVVNPRGWDTQSLEELLEFMTSGSRGWAKHYSDNGSLFLRIQNVGYDDLMLDDVAYVEAPNNVEAKRTLVQAGDVLMSVTADLGRTGVVPEGLGAAHINQHLVILRVDRCQILPGFLSAFLASAGGDYQIRSLTKGGVKAGLNFADIRSLEILVPPIEQQQKFLKIKSEIRNGQQRLQRTQQEAQFLFGSLTQRAFRGEL